MVGPPAPMAGQMDHFPLEALRDLTGEPEPVNLLGAVPRLLARWRLPETSSAAKEGQPVYPSSMMSKEFPEDALCTPLNRYSLVSDSPGSP